MNRWLGLGLLLAIMAGALALRLPALDARPMHNDEGINALKMRDLWREGRYAYDPHEFHGPALYYAALPFLWFSPARNFGELRETTLRLTTVAFGVGLILLLPLLADGLGRTGTLAAGALLAVSPAMVFYSRYFIHEMLLVFFTLLALGAAWRWVKTRQLVWAAVAGAGVGLMFATKETFVLSLVAAGVAVVGTVVLEKWWSEGRGGVTPAQSSGMGWRDLGPLLKHAVVMLGAVLVVWLLLFSSFFANPHGLVDSALTYEPWIHRAGGSSPHIHPWHDYLHRLLFFHPPRSVVWSEGFVLVLALVGAAAGLGGLRLGGAARGFVRFLALYSVGLLGIYSVIAYKTPWCLMNFWIGFLLLAGVGVGVLFELVRPAAWRGVLALALLAGVAHLGWQAWRASFVMPADRRNPYVYAQTTDGVLELTEIVERLATVHPEGHAMPVQVALRESYWPLPWYLRRFDHLGWYEAVPEAPYAPVVLSGVRLHAALEEKTGGKWRMTGMHELRPGVFFELYVEEQLWQRYVEANSARRTAGGE